MPATLTTINDLLKEVYEPRIQDQLQNETVTIKRIEQTSDGVVESTGGKYVDFPVHVQRNAGIGYRPESTALPTAGQQGFASVHVPLHYGYGVFQVTGQTMQLSDTNEKAFAKALTEEQEDLKDDLVKDSSRVVYSDGSGVLANITDTATSTSHTVDSTQYMEVGQQVDILTKSSGATVLLNTSVTNVVPSTLTVTFGGSFTGATTAAVYRQGNRNNEPSGFSNIIAASGALHGLDPSTQPKWASTVNNNSGSPGTPRPLSEGLMIQTCDQARFQGGQISVIFTSLGVRRAYFNLLTQQRRMVNTQTFEGGFTGLPFNYGREIPVVEDVDAPPNKMWFVEEKQFKVYRTKDWHYADDDGDIIKWIVGFDTWTGFMRKYWEIGTHRRNAHALLSDITEG
jgi:hypothetical protein